MVQVGGCSEKIKFLASQIFLLHLSTTSNTLPHYGYSDRYTFAAYSACLQRIFSTEHYYVVTVAIRPYLANFLDHPFIGTFVGPSPTIPPGSA